MKRTLIAALVTAAALGASAAVVRKLPPMTVVEKESVTIDARGAKQLRCGNETVLSASVRDSGAGQLTGLRLGVSQLSFEDERGVFAACPVTVVPACWEMLRKLFAEDPEISIEIIGDKIVVSGATSNVDTLKRSANIRQMDPRLVVEVSYSMAQIGALVQDFLSRCGYTDIGIKVVGHEVCLSGRLYDTQAIAQITKRTANFLKDFPGVSVNADQLRVYKQKITISVEFLQYDTTLARNLGIQTPDQLTAAGSLDYGWERGRDDKDSTHSDYSSSRTRSNEPATETTATGGGGSISKLIDPVKQLESLTEESGSGAKGDSDSDYKNSWTMKSSVKISDVKVTLNMLKQNGAAKSVSSTTLTTQSGMEAQFQKGGTIHKETSDLYKSDMKQIEYGYIVRATPVILDASSVNLDFDIDVKTYREPNARGDYQIPRYQTKSKYLVRPGETIVLSGFKQLDETEDKSGTPFLSRIPWIGPWLFGNRTQGSLDTELILAVTVNWALEDETEAARKRIDALKNKPLAVEMP